MEFDAFVRSLDGEMPPSESDPWLEALWWARKGEWDRAHRMVQALSDRKAARIHAYLHRVEGDEWNSRYWHRRAGTRFPEEMSPVQEWEHLVRLALASRGEGKLPEDPA